MNETAKKKLEQKVKRLTDRLFAEGDAVAVSVAGSVFVTLSKSADTEERELGRGALEAVRAVVASPIGDDLISQQEGN